MHILIVPSFYPTAECPLNGIFFKEQALMLKQRGLKIGVLYPEIRPLKTARLELLGRNYFQYSAAWEQGLATCRWHAWNLSPSYLKGTMHLWIYAVRRLFERYTAEQGMPDLIHAHSSLWAGIAVSQLCQNIALPYLLTEHRHQFLLTDASAPAWLQYSWLKNALRTAFGRAAGGIAVSAHLRNCLQQHLAPSVSHIQVLPNFIDTDLFCPTHQQRIGNPFTFLTVAHLVKGKNIDGLLHAFHRVLKVDCKLSLRIAGGGPEKKRLEQLAKQLNIGSNVEFLGEVPRDKIKEAYASAHAFVLPSRHETFGIAFIEALAMGLPLIGTRCGGPEEIIAPEVGMLLTQNTIDELAQAMLQMKQNYQLYDPERLRAYAHNHYGKEAVTQKLLKLYRR